MTFFWHQPKGFVQVAVSFQRWNLHLERWGSPPTENNAALFNPLTASCSFEEFTRCLVQEIAFRRCWLLFKQDRNVNRHWQKKLWSTGVLNPDTPQGLLNCIFFLNGKKICLRGGVEHKNLKPSQLIREVVKVNGKSLVRYTYTEFISKNRVGGLKQLK